MTKVTHTSCPLCSKKVSFAGFSKHLLSDVHRKEIEHLLTERQSSGNSKAFNGSKDSSRTLPYFGKDQNGEGQKTYHICFGCKSVKQSDNSHLDKCPHAKEHRDYLKKLVADETSPEISLDKLQALLQKRDEQIEKKDKQLEEHADDLDDLEKEIKRRDILLAALLGCERVDIPEMITTFEDTGVLPATLTKPEPPVVPAPAPASKAPSLTVPETAPAPPKKIIKRIVKRVILKTPLPTVEQPEEEQADENGLLPPLPSPPPEEEDENGLLPPLPSPPPEEEDDNGLLPPLPSPAPEPEQPSLADWDSLTVEQKMALMNAKQPLGTSKPTTAPKKQERIPTVEDSEAWLQRLHTVKQPYATPPPNPIAEALGQFSGVPVLASTTKRLPKQVGLPVRRF